LGCPVARWLSCPGSSPARNLFITFEGGEGAGKSTQARLLADALRARGQETCLTREPGGAPGAELLRTLLLAGTHDWSSAAETYLHFAARAEHLERTIRPARAAGAWVVCDRYADSTMAYQGYGQGGDRALIAALTRLLPVQPDRTLVLSASPGITAARMATRMIKRGAILDRYERQDAAFHERVRAGFAAIAAADPDRCRVIDAGGTQAETHALVLAALGL